MESSDKISYELAVAARDLAKRFLYRYVERGDSFESLKASHMGMGCMKESVCIGGWMDGKSWTTDYILVSKVDGDTVNKHFKHRDIIREIEGDIKIAEALEDFKLEPG
ncbi:MAG TPA: hypothetical protein PLN69_06625 [bacterium]|nr:hypothetical protein [bacterium]